MTTIATKVSGALRSVSTAKKASTIAVVASATSTIATFAPISARRRYAEIPTSRKIMSEQALPTEAIAERSTRFETTRTIPAVISIPARGPSGEPRPKKGGNWPAPASIVVRPPEA